MTRMTETDLLKIIRRITGISQQPDEQATQPDSVIAENYARVVAEVMRRDGIELNGVDMRNIRTRVLELLAYRRRSQQRRESAKNTYQWRKPEHLRRYLVDITESAKMHLATGGELQICNSTMKLPVVWVVRVTPRFWGLLAIPK